MATQPLDALVSVPPRKAWDHEAHDFTLWVASNLGRLATEIGIELEPEGTEVQVGPLRADIVARNPRDDTRVLIENQLEHADLHHLGQVLAYLAGLEAKTVIWVAIGFDVRREKAPVLSGCESRPATVVCGRLSNCKLFLSLLCSAPGALVSLDRFSATTEYPCCQGPGSREDLVRRGW